MQVSELYGKFVLSNQRFVSCQNLKHSGTFFVRETIGKLLLSVEQESNCEAITIWIIDFWDLDYLFKSYEYNHTSLDRSFEPRRISVWSFLYLHGQLERVTHIDVWVELTYQFKQILSLMIL